MAAFQLRLGRREPFLFTRITMQSKPVQFLLDFSGSMSSHFTRLIELAVTAARSGHNVITFSNTALLLNDDVTIQSFPRSGRHYGGGTMYTAGFCALQEFLTPDTVVVMLTDGEPSDRTDALAEVKQLHKTLGEGRGELGVYFLGHPTNQQQQTMQQLLFRSDHPRVFDVQAMEGILYGEMTRAVPIQVGEHGVSTGIWRVTMGEAPTAQAKARREPQREPQRELLGTPQREPQRDPQEDHKEFEDQVEGPVPDLATAGRPEITLACLASLLNFMAAKKVELSWEDSKSLNKLLEPYQAFPGVVALMSSMRQFAASCGIAGIDGGAVARLLASVSIVTGRVPNESLIKEALLALVKNPDPAFAQGVRAERDRLKAAYKRQARLGPTLKRLEARQVIAKAALATEGFLRQKTKAYRLDVRDLGDESDAAKAITQNPQCMAVPCDGQLYDFELAPAGHVLLPPSCQSPDYVEATLFSLTNQSLYTEQLRFCLLNPVWENPAMRKDVVRLLQLLPPLPCFATPDAQAPHTFMFNPTQSSAKTFFFYPFMIAGDPYQLHEAFVQGLMAVLHQACDPQPLEESRLRVPAPVDVPALVDRLRKDPNVPAVCAHFLPLVNYDTEVSPAEVRRMADTVLASYRTGADPIPGVTPPVPTKEQLLTLLATGVADLLPDHRGWPVEVTAASLIVVASLRLAVAASLKKTSSMDRYDAKDIVLGRVGLTFAPSEDTAKKVLLKQVGDDFIALAKLGADLPVTTLKALDPDVDPLVYLQLCNHAPDHLVHVLERVDWRRYQPESTWSQTAINCAAKLPIPEAGAAEQLAKLAHTFNGSALTAKDIARILVEVESCEVTGHVVREPPVLDFIPFTARDMRNALSLLDDSNKGLALLQTSEGARLSKDQVTVALKLRKLGVDVSSVGPLLTTSPLHVRVIDRWMKALELDGKALPTREALVVELFRHKNPTGYSPGIPGKDFYDARMRMFATIGGRALFRTELLGLMLERVGAFGQV
jgi:uncharacterized protein YegL